MIGYVPQLLSAVVLVAATVAGVTASALLLPRLASAERSPGAACLARWPVDIGSVVYPDHAHYAIFLVNAQNDAILAAPGAAEAFQLIMQRL